jgi:hypothetical protein
MMLYISLPLQMLFLPWVTSHEYKWITLPWRRRAKIKTANSGSGSAQNQGLRDAVSL